MGPDRSLMSRREAIFVWTTGAAASLLRILLVFRYRFDSDEPQHMHVAWGWARGLMQYRDVFDNHMPLFHVLSAPLFWLTGDDVNSLYLARLSVIPLFVASLALVFVIAERLYDHRTAAWATAFTALFPPYFLGMLEYRADDLWVVFWLACIAVLVSDIEPLRKAIAGGAFLGLAFAVSMKSVLFLVAIIIAAVTTVRLMRGRADVPPLRQVSGWLTSFGATALIAPVTIAVLFALAGAWRQFAYCVLWHNTSVPFDHTWWRVFWIVPLWPLTLRIGRLYARNDGDVALIRRRLFLFLVSAVYFIVLSALWPILALESYLPFYPLAIIAVTPILLSIAIVPSVRGVNAVAASILIVALVTTAAAGRVWRDDAHDEIALIRQVLQITRPSDPVMDLKGEALFRRRPYWFVLESITHRKLRSGTLRDDIAAALIRSGTSVLASTDFPSSTRKFVRHSYVPWGRLWVAGRRLPVTAVRGVRVPFLINLPSRYIVVDGSGVIEASIDGVPVGDGIELARGSHWLVVSRPAAQPLIIWSGVMRSAKFLAQLREMENYLDKRKELRRIAAR
jgi:dolichyl-phosphate-mannose-protein mannosyltransferase